MESTIIATHIIKPSSPTPLGLKIHKLSSLDQLFGPPIYVPLIFFYDNIPPTKISRHLRQSLSEILCIYYPLAGTKRGSVVDCDDRGVEFVEARVHARLGEFIQAPKMEETKKLVPVDSAAYDDGGFQLLVKLSYFDCGGVSVGISFSHRVGDTASFVGFMNAWAATCRRGGGETVEFVRPLFNLAQYFPPRDSPGAGVSLGPAIDDLSMVRLVFDGEKLEKLRKSDQRRPSRVEAVTAFIWREFIANAKSSPSPSPAVCFHVVNLRPRAVPPMPDEIFGNCLAIASVVAAAADDDVDALVAKLRAAVRAVDGDYIDRVLKDESFFREDGTGGAGQNKAGELFFTSWARFPMYEVDFGWGKPAWVCPTPMPFLNTVILMDTPHGDGIEAWINTHHTLDINPNSAVTGSGK